MRFSLAALASSFLLSSTLVHSHVLAPGFSSELGPNVVSIKVKIELSDEKSKDGDECDKEDGSCSDNKSDEDGDECDKEDGSCSDNKSDEDYWTYGSCKDKESSCRSPSTHKYGFQCGEKFFTQFKVLRAANAACLRISENSQRHSLPAAHTKFKFDMPGPYMEWPLNRYGWAFHRYRHGRERIIMTNDCTVVGAAVRFKKGKKYTKCYVKRH